MATWVALDLSLSSTGFAVWAGEDAALTHGHWKLADSMIWRARGYVRLHKALLEIHAETPIDTITFEEPLSQASVKGGSNIQTIQTLAGLAAHAESFAAAVKARWYAVNVASWRRHFIGSMPRGTKSPDLKAMTMKRCREMGKRQSDIVRDLDWNKARVSLMLRGEQPYNREAINEVAAYLNIQPYELLMRPEDAMALRGLRKEAFRVIEVGGSLEQTGTDG